MVRKVFCKAEIESQILRTNLVTKVGDELGDWEWHIYTTVYKIDYLHKEPYSVLYGHLIGKKNLKKKKCTLFFKERNWHNVVKQLYSNKNK